jgi:NAD(P)-dependent dehydrogenase (short-subunit alcohol dehydrogenase family)|tara:strand:- start:127 stop:879 length:753 start_codon:yes stop_codon:yes gene_type:complete
MEKLLEGKVALVTGSTHGIGRRVAEIFRESGAIGLGIDRTDTDNSSSDDWLFHEGDITDENTLKEATKKIKEHFGRLDIVVANAGVVPPWKTPEEIEISEWDHVFAVNVRGVAITIKHAVPLMKDQGGSVVLMGSLTSHRGYAGQMLYTSTKHAVLGIVRASSLDLGRYGIRVNAIGPGPIATDALMSRIKFRAEQGGLSVQEALKQLQSETALGRIATEDEVASVALFLSTHLSSGITGQIIPVDAGIS